jgi:hypothetical protein
LCFLVRSHSSIPRLPASSKWQVAVYDDQPNDDALFVA